MRALAVTLWSSFRMTIACTASPHSSSGMPITAHCDTAGVNESSVSSVTHGTEHIPDSVEMQIFANGHGVTESFTKIEVLDAATGVDQMAVSSRIRGIAARIAERFKL